jgi:hypothetical protein
MPGDSTGFNPKASIWRILQGRVTPKVKAWRYGTARYQRYAATLVPPSCFDRLSMRVKIEGKKNGLILSLSKDEARITQLT